MMVFSLQAMSIVFERSTDLCKIKVISRLYFSAEINISITIDFKDC